jgi:tRNA threonylcarbamoyladenosine modification (KEOPS) complex Cgi121 subunit
MDAFESLTELAKLGKKTKEVEIAEMKILLSTLNVQQEGDVFVTCADLTGNAYFYKLKCETLKYSIKAVNGQMLDAYEDIKIEADREKMRKETLEKIAKILSSWDENVISFLYRQWVELSKQSEEELKEKGIAE